MFTVLLPVCLADERSGRWVRDGGVQGKRGEERGKKIRERMTEGNKKELSQKGRKG